MTGHSPGTELPPQGGDQEPPIESEPRQRLVLILTGEGLDEEAEASLRLTEPRMLEVRDSITLDSRIRAIANLGIDRRGPELTKVVFELIGLMLPKSQLDAESQALDEQHKELQAGEEMEAFHLRVAQHAEQLRERQFVTREVETAAQYYWEHYCQNDPKFNVPGTASLIGLHDRTETYKETSAALRAMRFLRKACDYVDNDTFAHTERIVRIMVDHEVNPSQRYAPAVIRLMRGV